MTFFNAEENVFKEELTPKGWHKVTVESIELKYTKNGGSYWNVRFGLENGKNFFNMFHWTHLSNAEFQARSRSAFSDFAWACGVTKAADENELIFELNGKQCYVLVNHRTNKDNGEESTEIKSCASLEKKHRTKGAISFDIYKAHESIDKDVPF